MPCQDPFYFILMAILCPRPFMLMLFMPCIALLLRMVFPPPFSVATADNLNNSTGGLLSSQHNKIQVSLKTSYG